MLEKIKIHWGRKKRKPLSEEAKENIRRGAQKRMKMKAQGEKNRTPFNPNVDVREQLADFLGWKK